MTTLKKQPGRAGRILAVIAMVIICVGGARVWAINAFVSQDIPFLSALVAQGSVEAGQTADAIAQRAESITQTAEQIAQGAKLVEDSAKMAETLAGIADLSEVDKRSSLNAANSVLGEFGIDVGRLQGLSDLDAMHPEAVMRLQQKFSEEVYRELGQFDASAEATSGVIAEAYEAHARQEARRQARVHQLNNIEADSSSLLNTEAGNEAVKMAGAHGAILGAQGVLDGNEQRGQLLQLQATDVANRERERAENKRQYLRFVDGVARFHQQVYGTSSRRPKAQMETVYVGVE